MTAVTDTGPLIVFARLNHLLRNLDQSRTQLFRAF